MPWHIFITLNIRSRVIKFFWVADFCYDLYLLIITKLLNNKYLRLFNFYFHTLIQQRQFFKYFSSSFVQINGDI